MNDALILLAAFVVIGLNQRRLGRLLYVLLGLVIMVYVYRVYKS